MKSDHWNFLANLLGTPSPSEPPKKKKEAEAKEAPSPAERGRQEPQKPLAEEPTPSDEPVSSSASATPPQEPAAANILEALSAAVPPQVLPGFGRVEADRGSESTSYRESSSRRPSIFDADEDESDEVDAPRQQSAPSLETDEGPGDGNEFESAWGELAAELGVEPTPPPPPRRAEDRLKSEPISQEKEKSRGTRDRARRGEGGFGQGLGFEEAEQERDASRPTAELAADREVEADELDIDWREPEIEPPSRRSFEEPEQRGRGDSRRGEPRQQRSDRQDRTSEDRGSRAPHVDAEIEPWEDRDEARGERPREEESESERGPSRRRRRGRRGMRQRMGEEEQRRTETTGEDFAEPREERQGPREGEARDAGVREGARRDERRRDERRREQGRREERDGGGRDRERVGPPSARRDVEDFDDFAGDLEAEVPAAELESDRGDDATSRSRSRRRGRRGRGRGRDTDASRRIDHERPVQERSAQERIEAESAFDDDHEDDLEVEAIRRGRRPRSADRGRDEGARDEGGRDERTERRTRPEEEDRGGRSRGRETVRDIEEEADDNRSQRRTAIPTWLETVELLVNANIENHKKSKGGGRGRGGKRR